MMPGRTLLLLLPLLAPPIAWLYARADDRHLLRRGCRCCCWSSLGVTCSSSRSTPARCRFRRKETAHLRSLLDVPDMAACGRGADAMSAACPTAAVIQTALWLAGFRDRRLAVLRQSAIAHAGPARSSRRRPRSLWRSSPSRRRARILPIDATRPAVRSGGPRAVPACWKHSILWRVPIA